MLGKRAVCRLAAAQCEAQCRNGNRARHRDGKSRHRIAGPARSSDFCLHPQEERFVRVAGFPFQRGERRLVQLESLIRAIPDFPIPGILFRDITPLLADPDGFRAMVDLFVQKYSGAKIDYVVGIEARGYMLGAPVAYALKAGFIPVRKPGKLPGEKYTEEYELEYGTNTLEIHADAIGKGKRVLVIDDLLATGGTMAATLRLLARLGADIAGVGVLIELADLNGRAALPNVPVTSFISY
jgi:adenine phosphoribosyltransferase